MSRTIPFKSLTLLALIAALGTTLAPLGAQAAPPIHITPSMGHPLTFDLRDQLRFPKVQDPIASDDTGLPTVRMIRRPGRSKPVRGN
jgi:hypothetical protein